MTQPLYVMKMSLQEWSCELNEPKGYTHDFNISEKGQTYMSIKA